MAGRECYHCKQWVEEGEEHDCWTTTEAALTQDLSGRSAQRLGTAARDRRLFWRSADLRLAQIDHVLAQILLLLRASEEELSRGLRVPRPRAEGSSGATRRSRIEVQGRSLHSDQAPRRGRGAVTEWLREAYQQSESLATRTPKKTKGSTARAPKAKRTKRAKRR